MHQVPFLLQKISRRELIEDRKTPVFFFAQNFCRFRSYVPHMYFERVEIRIF